MKGRHAEPKKLDQIFAETDLMAKYPISMHILEGDGTFVRCQVTLNPRGAHSWIDIPIREFNMLPRTEG